MGTSTSKLEQEISADHHLSNEHFYGLFGNTCYCNSVIQALYFCRPFREKVLAYKQQLKKSGQTKDNLLTCLADLFHNISTQKRRMGTIAPKKFITKLKKENELFDNYMQQDAHEFLNYLLNTIADIMEEERNSEQSGGAAQRHGGTAGTSAGGGQQSAKLSQVVGAFKSPRVAAANVLGSQGSAVGAECNRHAAVSPDGISLQAPSEGGAQDGGCSSSGSEPTWVHDIFQGTLTNETRCLNCESVSSKDEDFLDLSLEVETNASITHCLRVFSNMETLCNEHKYYCEYCCSKQEAQKRMRVKRLPKILALHLKRFKYQEQVSRYTKLSYRVLFPMELRLFNMADDATNADRMYDLVAVVVHCGATPNRGHYITVVKSHSFWLLFDDDMVDKIEPFAIEEFFGLSDAGVQKNSESAYILFYQARDCTAAVTTGSGGAAAQTQHAAAAQSHAAAAQSHAAAAQSHGNVNGLPPEAPAAAAGQPHATKLNA